MSRCIIVFSVLLVSACATRMTSKTYVGRKPGDPVKTTVINHTWWMGLPALAPMDAGIKDGGFEVNSKAVDLPDFDFSKED